MSHSCVLSFLCARLTCERKTLCFAALEVCVGYCGSLFCFVCVSRIPVMLPKNSCVFVVKSLLIRNVTAIV